ncbi:hypothetical protein NQD34_014046 [Periophthalmus magnuspinnatus]|nr:hypothetical protein NQD34_014046 [Periophthalmus magnuspinnatus]
MGRFETEVVGLSYVYNYLTTPCLDISYNSPKIKRYLCSVDSLWTYCVMVYFGVSSFPLPAAGLWACLHLCGVCRDAPVPGYKHTQCHSASPALLLLYLNVLSRPSDAEAS